MLTFGYVMGDKTLHPDIQEIAPHCWYKISLIGDTLDLGQTSYWSFQYTYEDNRSEQALEEQFDQLWHDQLNIYTDFVKHKNALAYIPLSGGLDSRLLVSYFDEAGIDIYSMTFGFSPSSPEIRTARQVMSLSQHIIGHNILYFDHPLFKLLMQEKNHIYDMLTCAHYERMLLSTQNIFTAKNYYYVPGHDANFMAGENIKLKMNAWKGKEDIIEYILAFKSSRLTNHLIKSNPDVGITLRESLDAVIPDEQDLITAYNRWNCEQRQRRYIIRSSINISDDDPNILLPFFDYELMDFFMKLPVKLLLNQRLYVNTQLTHLFRHKPEFAKLKRDGLKRQRRIRSNYWTEYYPKMKSKAKKALKIKKAPVKHWSETMDWSVFEEYINKGVYELIPTDWMKESQFALNLFYLKNISDVYSEIQSNNG
jgi:asparagine synthase (glutamine-hydrolysing)